MRSLRLSPRLIGACLGAASLAGCDLPPGGLGGGNGSYFGSDSSYDAPSRRPLRITDATWRADNGRSADATAVIRGSCEREQQCQIRADNRYFGDPAPGHVKRLIIGYRCGYGRLEFVIPENKTLMLACRN